MSSRLIKYNLAKDLFDSTAQAVLDLNPEMFDTLDDVPPWAYKSLNTLWMVSGGPSANLANSIVATIGIGDNTSLGDIEIVARPNEHIYVEQSYKSDEPGSEVSVVDILIRKGRRLSNLSNLEFEHLVENVELRIRHVLDVIRRQARGLPSGLDIGGSYNLAKNAETPFTCTWQGFVESPNANEIASRYLCSYVRPTPRDPLA